MNVWLSGSQGFRGRKSRSDITFEFELPTLERPEGDQTLDQTGYC